MAKRSLIDRCERTSARDRSQARASSGLCLDPPNVLSACFSDKSCSRYFPVPLNRTVWVPPFALSVIVNFPVCGVVPLGVNVTEIEQEEPAARLAGQLLVCMNTPGSEIISICTGSPGCVFLPLGLDTFTIFGLLVVPTVVFGNLTVFGLILSVTATGVGVAVGVAVAVAVPLVDVAVAVGVPLVDVAVAVGVAVLVAVAVAVDDAVVVGVEV